MRYADDIENVKQEKIHRLLPISEQTNQEEKKKTLSREHLANRLNYINFQNGTITVNLKHKKFNCTISLQAKPFPCLGNSLYCTWVDTESLRQKLKLHQVLNFVIPDNQKLILVEAEVKSINEEGISFSLPERCHEVVSRQAKRYQCEISEVDLIQHGTIFRGNLIDFSAVALRIEVTRVPPQTFQWINPESAVTVIIQDKKDVLYSGECEIIRHTCGQQTRTYVLRPLLDQIRRFKPKKYRSARHKLVPSPNIIFPDPFTGKNVNLKAIDLSGTGFSVEEDAQDSVLIPGKIIPELSIDFANIFQITCKAQVVYRHKRSDEKQRRKTVKCGLAILDIDIQSHVKLLGLLNLAGNNNSYICNKVDLDALWNFFFETGFVYPEKYSFIQSGKEQFKRIYEYLYTCNPSIARHFIYQSNGTIYGHMAMIRFYENTWLIHHHAAIKSPDMKAGLVVLNHVGQSINDSHGLYSAHMNFVICYFRADNKFPKRVFGGVANHINDLSGCSIDTFAYFHFHKKNKIQWDSDGSWCLLRTTPDDLTELECFYNYKSGGLMLNACDLELGMIDCNDLKDKYRELGLRREKYVYSLKNDNGLKAIFIINISDFGLNMSDLTNSIHVIVLDSDDVPKEIFFKVISVLSNFYRQEKIPVLVYPASYADNHLIIPEKHYNLWILNLQYTDKYFEYINNFTSCYS